MSSLGRFNAVRHTQVKTEGKNFHSETMEVNIFWYRKIKEGLAACEEILLFSHPKAQIHFSVNKQLLVPVLSINYMQN